MRNAATRAAYFGNALFNRAGQRPFICCQCLAHAPSLPQSSSLDRHAIRHASSKNLPVTERIRRKIWGTDNPPGPKDPYGESKLFPRKEEVEEEDEATSLSAPLKPEDDPSYKPADTWEGLDRIGGAKGWWEAAWDAENQYEGFTTASKEAPRSVWPAVHQALVECTILLEAGVSPSEIGKLPLHSSTDLTQVKATGGDDGKIILSSDEVGWRGAMLAALQGIAQPAPDVKLSKAAPESEGQQTVTVEATTSREWSFKLLDKQASLSDSALKFAVTKRLMQLTGRRIPDPIIHKAKDIGDIGSFLFAKPKPKKLIDALAAQHKLTALSNVQLFNRRHTPIDKEKEVGRWKVIEKALQDKDLPVTGHLGAGA